MDPDNAANTIGNNTASLQTDEASADVALLESIFYNEMMGLATFTGLEEFLGGSAESAGDGGAMGGAGDVADKGTTNNSDVGVDTDASLGATVVRESTCEGDSKGITINGNSSCTNNAREPLFSTCEEKAPLEHKMQSNPSDSSPIIRPQHSASAKRSSNLPPSGALSTSQVLASSMTGPSLPSSQPGARKRNPIAASHESIPNSLPRHGSFTHPAQPIVFRGVGKSASLMEPSPSENLNRNYTNGIRGLSKSPVTLQSRSASIASRRSVGGVAPVEQPKNVQSLPLPGPMPMPKAPLLVSTPASNLHLHNPNPLQTPIPVGNHNLPSHLQPRLKATTRQRRGRSKLPVASAPRLSTGTMHPPPPPPPPPPPQALHLNQTQPPHNPQGLVNSSNTAFATPAINANLRPISNPLMPNKPSAQLHIPPNNLRAHYYTTLSRPSLSSPVPIAPSPALASQNKLGPNNKFTPSSLPQPSSSHPTPLPKPQMLSKPSIIKSPSANNFHVTNNPKNTQKKKIDNYSYKSSQQTFSGGSIVPTASKIASVNTMTMSPPALSKNPSLVANINPDPAEPARFSSETSAIAFTANASFNTILTESFSDINRPSSQNQQCTKQLVNQFASLATRLGINLPPSVLKSLNVAAVAKIKSEKESASRGAEDSIQITSVTKQELERHNDDKDDIGKSKELNEAKSEADTTKISNSEVSSPKYQPTPSTNDVTAQNIVSKSSSPPSTIQRLQETAQEAIAAITEPRVSATPKCPIGENSTLVLPANCDDADLDHEDNVFPSLSSSNNSFYAKYRGRRKRPRLKDCQARYDALRAENAQLKRHLDAVTFKSAKFDAERAAAEKNMKDMLKKHYLRKKRRRKNLSSNASCEIGASIVEDEGRESTSSYEAELGAVLAKFTEMYADYGKHRHQELTFHLGQLQRLAVPTTFTKMSLWTLGQKSQFFRNPRQNPIAGILMKELNITVAQGRKIIEHRGRIQSLSKNLKKCFTLLKKLRGLCERKQKVFNDRMTRCQEILTPLQVVKLLTWVDDNVRTLESVCPGWGSERIRSTQSDKPFSRT